MHLTLDTIIELGGFCSGDLIEREVSFIQGDELKTFTVFVKPLSYADYVQELSELSKGTTSAASRIAASICKPDGSPIFTPEDITGEGKDRGPMNADLTTALHNLVLEVSGMGKILISPKKTNSGTNSSSTESEAEPSPKPSAESVAENSSSGTNTEPNAVH